MKNPTRLIVWLGSLITVAIVAYILFLQPNKPSTGNQETSSTDHSKASSPRNSSPAKTTESTRQFQADTPRTKLKNILDIDDVDERNYEIEEFLAAHGPEHLELIRELFESELDDSRHMREFEHFLKWWVDFDPQSALTYAASDLHGDDWDAKHLAATVAAEHWLEKDPRAAAAHMAELPPGVIRSNIMTGFGQEYAMKDLDAAIAWADSDDSPEYREAALYAVAYGALRAGMHEEFKPEITDQTANWLAEHADQPYAAKALAEWVDQVVREDSEQGTEWVSWVTALPEGVARNAALDSFFRNARHNSPEALTQWMSEVKDSPVMDQAAANFVSNARHESQDPDSIAFLTRIAENVQDPQIREQVRNQVSQLKVTPPEE